MYSSGTPIFLPHLWPHSYYNVRYGLSALPLAAFVAGALAATLPRRWQGAAAAIVAVVAVSPWIVNPSPEAWIVWKEGRVNHAARRAWTAAAADYLRERYRHGSGILIPFGDAMGVVRAAGIPMIETLHEGNGPRADAVRVRPDLFLNEEWAVALSGDSVSSLMARVGAPYVRVKTIEVKGAQPVEVYRRIQPLPHL
jgi:hypothetical protein